MKKMDIFFYSLGVHHGMKFISEKTKKTKKTVFILMRTFLEINMLEKIVTASNFNEVVLYTFWRFCKSL